MPYAGKTKNGILIVIPNTDTERVFGKMVKDDFIFEERLFSEAVEGDYNLRKPSIPHRNKDVFIGKYKKYGFRRAAKVALKKDIVKYRIFNMIYKNKLAIKLIKIIKG